MSPQWELDVACKVQDFKGVILEMSCPWLSLPREPREGGTLRERGKGLVTLTSEFILPATSLGRN